MVQSNNAQTFCKKGWHGLAGRLWVKRQFHSIKCSKSSRFFWWSHNPWKNNAAKCRIYRFTLYHVRFVTKYWRDNFKGSPKRKRIRNLSFTFPNWNEISKSKRLMINFVNDIFECIVVETLRLSRLQSSNQTVRILVTSSPWELPLKFLEWVLFKFS